MYSYQITLWLSFAIYTTVVFEYRGTFFQNILLNCKNLKVIILLYKKSLHLT